ncbi:MAG: MAPEG family protein [Pseudomonadota bacterium]
MTGFEAATLYAGLFVLLFLGLKLNAGRSRAGAQVSIGDGGDGGLQKAMRTQANAAEDVPVVMIGVFALAGLGAPVALIHGLGGGFFVARLLHGLGMAGFPGLGIGRLIGTLGTLVAMLVTAGACIWLALS